MNPVVHFEMPYEDSKRMSEFYTKAFGWVTKQLGAEMGHYVLAQTDETDEKGMLKETGRINGGFFQKTEDPNKGGKNVSIVIAVEDIQEAAKRVEAAGGKVHWGALKPGEPDEIPGIGLYSAFTDSEGNRIGMLQPTEM